jgi:hypothetical protein
MQRHHRSDPEGRRSRAGTRSRGAKIGSAGFPVMSLRSITGYLSCNAFGIAGAKPLLEKRAPLRKTFLG